MVANVVLSSLPCLMFKSANVEFVHILMRETN